MAKRGRSGPRKRKRREIRSRKSSRRKGRDRADKSEQLSGIITLSPDGSARLAPEEAARSSVYLPPQEVVGLRSGDRITVRLETGRKGRLRGRLVSKGRRSTGPLVGVLLKRGGSFFVDPEPTGLSVLISPNDLGGARRGEAVLVELLVEAKGHRPPEGRILRSLGRPDDPAVQVEMLISGLGLPIEFSREVIAAADQLAAPGSEELGEREDLRDLPHVTVDGADARDFDDAVAALPEGEGFRVWVSIADVAHYVRARSPIDVAAVDRGTSVYFPHKAIPMLPPRLSNDLCSLRPNELRYAITCEMQVQPDGRRRGIRIYPSLIRSHARLTYEEVQQAFDGESEPELDDHLDQLLCLGNVARLLRKRREMRGAVELDLPEPRIVVGSDGRAQDIGTRDRLEAHRMIEDLMIAANESVAEHLSARRLPTLYRVHKSPDGMRLANLARWGARVGLGFDAEAASEPKILARFANALRETEKAAAGHMMLLRSMAQAHYSTENGGHYALASKAYLHFTSPIRRYPDLLVHRALWASWGAGGKPHGLKVAADRTSMQERRAMEGERSVAQLMACHVAIDHLGERLAATVVGVHRAGLFVRGTELFVEGLIAMEDLKIGGDGYFDLLEEEQMLIARKSGRRIGLGDAIDVRILSVDPRRRQINFEPALSERRS